MKISQVSLALWIPLVFLGCSAPPPQKGSPTPVVVVTATEAPRATPSSSPTPGGPIPSSPSATPQVRASATPAAVAFSSQVLKLEETGVTKALDCQGQDVVISGNENHITLRGKVGKLTVQGSTNQISVANASVVDISGVENRVQWDGKEPQIHNPGNDNRVSSVAGPAPTPTPLIP